MGGLIDLGAAGEAFGILSTQWSAWAWVVPGLLIGLVVGAIPGFGPGAALAILLPAAYYLDFLPAIIFMTAIFTGGSFGSAIPSILINVPGSPSAVATTFDGYPMTRQGRHNEALGIALAASVFGTALSYALLLLFIETLSRAVLALGPTEMLVVVLWGISLIALMGGRHLARGLLAGVVGILLGTIGFGLMGTVRGTMGVPHMLDGVSAVAAMVGLFAVAEMFLLARRSFIIRDTAKRKLDFRRILAGVGIAIRLPVIMIRGGVIGGLVGMMPGVGAAIANLMSYEETKRRDRKPEEFGRGTPKGVVAAESANSSSEGGSMLTLLALGIPAGAATALLFTVFAINNITGGPRFFVDNKPIVYAIVFNNMAQAVILFFIGLGLIHAFAAVVRVPNRYLVPTVIATSVVASYIVAGGMVGPVTLLVFAVVGWFMRRHGYPLPAMVVGLLLGRQLEEEALRSVQISGRSVAYVLDRPITLALIAAMALSMAWPTIARWMRRRRQR